MTKKKHKNISQVGPSLETLVFGDDSAEIFKDQQPQPPPPAEAADNEEPHGLLDFCISTAPSESIDENEEEEKEAPAPKSGALEAAWSDDDDGDAIQIEAKHKQRMKKLRVPDEDGPLTASTLSKRLRTEFDQVVGQPTWASLDTCSTVPEDLVSGDILKRGHGPADGSVGLQRLKDANASKPQRSTIQCLQFHPRSTILLSAGFDKTLNLFKIEGEKSTKLQSVFLEKFPIYAANFALGGQQIILSSRRNYFHVYDVKSGHIDRVRLPGKMENSLEKFVVSPSGDQLAFLGDRGSIHIVSAKSKRSLYSLKMNGLVTCACFSSNGEELYTAGGDGEVYIWNLKLRRCSHKFQDEGCLSATSIAFSGNHLACGSSSGVVNIYNSDYFKSRRPTPLKSIMNLTTSVTQMEFNQSSEVLAFSSSSVRDSMKLFLSSSMTVFSRWPTSSTPLGYVHSMAFSKQSGYLAIGNDNGRALLYRLTDYPPL